MIAIAKRRLTDYQRRVSTHGTATRRGLSVNEQTTARRFSLSRSQAWWLTAAGSSAAAKLATLVMILAPGLDSVALRLGMLALTLPLDVLVGGMLAVWWQHHQSPH